MTTVFHPEYRFYSFVAALYISPLQCGLQTAHAVSQMHVDIDEVDPYEVQSNSVERREIYDTWAAEDKTIIICNALNSAGVEHAYQQLQYFVDHGINLPITIFHEDAQSLNGAATAAAVVVPEHFFNAKPAKKYLEPTFLDKLRGRPHKKVDDGYTFQKMGMSLDRIQIAMKGDDPIVGYAVYPEGSIEAQFIAFLKSYRLA